MKRIVAAAALLTAVLLVPYAGPWLALGLLAASVWYYQDLVADTGRDGVDDDQAGARLEPGAWRVPALARLTYDAPFPDAGARRGGAPSTSPSPRAVVARVGLAALAATGLVAPVLVRNVGSTHTSSLWVPGTYTAMAVAFVAGWVVMPLVLFLTGARDRRGPLAPRLALAALARHPFASFAALALAPVGLIVLEAALALFTIDQGVLPLFVVDLFPPPETKFTDTGYVWLFDYDNHEIEKPFGDSTGSYLPIYRAGLARGFTLTATVPMSIARGGVTNFSPENLNSTWTSYLALRTVLTFGIVLVLGVVFSVQARWLALIASLAPRRPPGTRPAGIGRSPIVVEV